MTKERFRRHLRGEVQTIARHACFLVYMFESPGTGEGGDTYQASQTDDYWRNHSRVQGFKVPQIHILDYLELCDNFD